MKGYLAGPLFNSGEVRERLREGSILKEQFPNEVWYNPIVAPINDKSKLPTALDIFKGDYNEVLNADLIIADLTNNDTGVAMELGIAIGINEAIKNLAEIIKSKVDEEIATQIFSELKERGFKHKRILAHNSDIRVATSGEYKGNHVPYGQNQFVVGGVEYMGEEIYSSFDKIVEKRQAENECKNCNE